MSIPVTDIQTPLRFMGVAGSPYTRKMRAMLRFRGIPYRQLRQGGSEVAGMPKPKVPLLPTFYLPNKEGVEVAVTDSTPLIRRFDSEYSGRSVLPTDPVMRFLDYLLEDFGDEWLTKCMFHFRWAHEENIEKAGDILPFYMNTAINDEMAGAFKAHITKLQVSRIYVVGSNETTAPIIEGSYVRFLELFDAHLQNFSYLLGNRPSACDFAQFGQLTQLALFDPTCARLTLKHSPRVYAWTENTEDLSGIEVGEEDWVKRDAIPETLRAILGEVGRVYVPFLLGNASAIAAGSKEVDCTVDGKQWVQPAFPYQAKCLKWIRAERDALSEDDRKAVDGILAGTGCEALF